MTISGTAAFSVRYVGPGPVYWSRDPLDFGLQDKDDQLMSGAPHPEGGVVFRFELGVRTSSQGAVVFTGPFAHGPPRKRFLYLSWRRPTGGYDQRLKLPLYDMDAEALRQSCRDHLSISCVLVDDTPRATSTGANIGGTRLVRWRIDSLEASAPRSGERPDLDAPRSAATREH